MIIGQKWLALNSISNIEAWNDYRRLGWPEFPNSAASGIGQNERPLRFMYPESERSTNNENASKQGNDEMTVSPVWWDQYALFFILRPIVDLVAAHPL